MRAFLLLALTISCGSGNGGASTPLLLGAQPRLALQPDGGLPAIDAPFDTFVVRVATTASPSSVKISCQHLECTLVSATGVPGSPRGVLAVVVDDSGSNTALPTTCVGCPTDPDGVRKDAVKALFRGLLADGGYRAALFDFGPANNSPGFLTTRMLAGYTEYPDDLVAGADQLSSGGGTFLYDALAEVTPTVAAERQVLDAGSDAPVHLLVATDGEDTASTYRLTDALGRAASLGVQIDAIGYGQPDGGTIPLLVGRAFRDLRVTASATGGFCSITPTAQLPALFEHLGASYLSGSVELVVSVPEGTRSVSGTVSADGQSLPFSF